MTQPNPLKNNNFGPVTDPTRGSTKLTDNSEVRACCLSADTELVSKMHEIEAMYNEAVDVTQDRASRLEEALFVSENFQLGMMETMRSLRVVHNNLLSQDSPSADPLTVHQQLGELQVSIQSVLFVICINAKKEHSRLKTVCNGDTAYIAQLKQLKSQSCC